MSGNEHSGCSTLGEIILLSRENISPSHENISPSHENISPSREKYFTGFVKAFASLVLQIEVGKIFSLYGKMISPHYLHPLYSK